MRFDADTLLAVLALNAEYTHALDDGDLDRWPELFIEHGVYRLQSRENFERGLPLATMTFESRGMLKDRVWGARETIFHDPYSQRHVVGLPRLLGVDDDGTLRTEANYIVVRTKRDAMPELLSVGRYLDKLVPSAEGLRFAERLAIFDNDLIANSLILPV